MNVFNVDFKGTAAFILRNLQFKKGHFRFTFLELV